MINFNDPFVGEVIMYVIVALFTIVTGYTIFQFTRPFEEKLAKLRQKATSTEESPERLIFLLQQTAKYELTMLGADYSFCQKDNKQFGNYSAM